MRLVGFMEACGRTCSEQCLHCDPCTTFPLALVMFTRINSSWTKWRLARIFFDGGAGGGSLILPGPCHRWRRTRHLTSLPLCPNYHTFIILYHSMNTALISMAPPLVCTEFVLMWQITGFVNALLLPLTFCLPLSLVSCFYLIDND